MFAPFWTEPQSTTLYVTHLFFLLFIFVVLILFFFVTRQLSPAILLPVFHDLRRFPLSLLSCNNPGNNRSVFFFDWRWSFTPRMPQHRFFSPFFYPDVGLFRCGISYPKTFKAHLRCKKKITTRLRAREEGHYERGNSGGFTAAKHSSIPWSSNVFMMIWRST